MILASVNLEAALRELTTRPRCLKDSAEFGDLVARCSKTEDERDIEALGELFVPKGSIGHNRVIRFRALMPSDRTTSTSCLGSPTASTTPTPNCSHRSEPMRQLAW